MSLWRSWLGSLSWCSIFKLNHNGDVTMGVLASRTTSLTIVYSIVPSGADQRKHQSSASQAFVRGIHWLPVNSPHKWPVTRKMFPFDDVIMPLQLTRRTDARRFQLPQFQAQCSNELMKPNDILIIKLPVIFVWRFYELIHIRFVN